MVAGARLFRALLAADVDLQKKTSGTNQLLIVVFSDSDPRKAGEVAKSLAAGDVKGMSVVTEASGDATLKQYASRVPAGIFVATPAQRAALASLVKYGIDHHVIVYSPFDGDVEAGVLGGLSIEAQVRPFINRATLDAARINLKSFFLQVAKVYQ